MKKGNLVSGMRAIIIAIATALCLSVIVCAVIRSGYAALESYQYYTKTPRVDSSSGEVRIYGNTTNGGEAKFTILKYTSPTAYTGVYTSAPLTSCGTAWKNYSGLAYAGYMQPYGVAQGVTGEITVVTN